MDMLLAPGLWLGMLKIVWINLILSGDNAVVIALAARTLPARQQKLAVFWGSAAAVVLRVVLTLVAARLLELPYLQVIGGLLLLWIGVKLLAEDEDDGRGELHHRGTLVSAVRTILIADLVMSLDNVIAVAAAAQGSVPLLVFGLAISIPLVIFGATLMVTLMERFPFIVIAGAALIGWVGGETIASDQVLAGVIAEARWLHYACALLGAALVVVAGPMLRARSRKDSA